MAVFPRLVEIPCFLLDLERDAVAPAQMGKGEVPDLTPPSGAPLGPDPATESAPVCPLVSSSCGEWVTKSRMTGDCHVRF